MLRKLWLFIFLIISFFYLSGSDIYASFGISPADLTFNNLLPGGVFEKEFLISRTDLENDLDIIVETDVEGADYWLKVEPGVAFTIPKGQRTKKMRIKVDVPENISLNVYEGYINVKTSPDEDGSGVAVVGGVGISVRLSVGENETTQLFVRNLEILNITESKPLLLLITVENQGNIKVKPEKVEIIVTDNTNNEIMKAEKNDFELISPGKVKDLAIKYANNLSKGEYVTDVTVYFKGQIIKKDKLYFSISEGIKETRDFKNINLYCIINILLVFVTVVILILLTMVLRKRIKKVIL